MSKIPATVVTGFLGAGKTTLIRNLLADARGRRIALIVNEFGDVGVDGEVLKGCGDAACADEDIVELANGCICCTVADDFIPTMERLLTRETPPEHIVIETSGLALPQPLVRAFAWPQIRTRVTVDGVVTVVDTPAAAEGRFAHDQAAVEAQRQADAGLDHDTPLADLFEDQLACADIVVLSKTDTLAADAVAAVERALDARTRDGVRLIRSGAGGLPAAHLLGLGLAAEDDIEAREEVHHHHHDDDDDDDDHHDAEHAHGHDAFESFVLALPPVADPCTFGATLAAAIRQHGLLRVKGFATVPGKPMRLVVQAAGPRVETWFDRTPANGDTRLVVIGTTGLDRAAIGRALGHAPSPAPA